MQMLDVHSSTTDKAKLFHSTKLQRYLRP